MARLTKHSRGLSSITHGTGDIFKKKWPRLFFFTAFVQTVVGIAFMAYTFAKFTASLSESADDSTQTNVIAQLKTIPTFLSLFIFGFLYELLLVWDALRLKNEIQVIGICIANLAFLVYSAIQINQVDGAIVILLQGDELVDLRIWAEIRPFLIAIPCIVAFISLIFGFIAWKLYQEFAWDILKQIGADYRMKRRFLHYQVSLQSSTDVFLFQQHGD
jgi:hypothetical protein